MRTQLGVELEYIFWYYDGDGGDNEKLRNQSRRVAGMLRKGMQVSDEDLKTFTDEDLPE